MKQALLIIFSLGAFNVQAQDLSAQQILDKSIAYHDPANEWGGFSYQLYFDQDLPDGKVKKEIISLDNRVGYFRAERDGKIYEMRNDSCFVNSKVPDNCDRTTKLRNYYLYLWGLPMKLKDPGTNLSAEVKTSQFNGYDTYVLKVPYEKDTWYFFIDQQNFALRGYEFYFDESANKGERIELENELAVGKMKIPANRKWINLEDQQYLATDKLVSVKRLP